MRESLKNLHKAGSHRAREPVAVSGQRGESIPGPPILRKTYSSQSFNLVGVGVLLGLRFCTLVSPRELLKSLMSRLQPPQLSSGGETQASKSSKAPSDSDMWQRIRTSALDLSGSCSPDPLWRLATGLPDLRVQVKSPIQSQKFPRVY